MKRTTNVGQNGIVHNSVKEGVECDVIPPLTKGLQLIDQLVQALIIAMRPKNTKEDRSKLAVAREGLQ